MQPQEPAAPATPEGEDAELRKLEAMAKDLEGCGLHVPAKQVRGKIQAESERLEKAQSEQAARHTLA
eukprot:15446839-Alexandrium_andersonii.AAC.1